MNIREKISKYKWILIGTIATAIISVGVVFGINYYTYSKSCEYSYGKFQAALTSANMAELAHLVDFKTISSHLAKETAKTFPFYFAGPNQEQKISYTFQTHLLKLLRQKPEPNDDRLITDPAVLLQKPVYVLPPDVVTQVSKNMTLRNQDPHSIIITSHFDHPLLKHSFPLILSMKDTGEGWIISDILNAAEILTEFREIFNQRLLAQKKLIAEKSKRVVDNMHKTMEIQGCTADAGVISDKKTLLVVVHLLARNKTTLTVKNVNATTDILDAKGNVLLTRNLNTSQPTGPSADFSHRWTIELDAASDDGQRILNAGPLVCRATWRTITMSNSRVYHAEIDQGELGTCKKHKDRHYEGLCEMPIFSEKNEPVQAKGGH
ncbi:MAG: hypothetical protein K5657_07325 [Desulfovibrio sp.]|nr:hypothetical protein [Desulfovibrio sp.]